jgi:hypothetical protein
MKISDDQRGGSANGLVRETHANRPVGNERPGRSRTGDDLHQQQEKNRGVQEVTTTPTTNVNPVNPEEPIQNLSAQMAKVINRIAGGLGESQQSSQTPMHGLQPMDGLQRAKQVEPSRHDHNSNGHHPT